MSDIRSMCEQSLSEQWGMFPGRGDRGGTVCVPEPLHWATVRGRATVLQPALSQRGRVLRGKSNFAQECIPVGCVPSAAVAVRGGGCLPRGSTPPL